jgi:hypothetical protein
MQGLAHILKFPRIGFFSGPRPSLEAAAWRPSLEAFWARILRT